jgi:hypothetical protein
MNRRVSERGSFTGGFSGCFGVLAAVVVVAAVGGALLGRSSAKSAASPVPQASPLSVGRTTSAPTPEPTAVAPMEAGFGDTATNPDKSYACAFEAFTDDNLTIFAYTTIAGPDSAGISSLCEVARNSAVFREVSRITVAGPAACHETAAGGGATMRIYVAPDGDMASARALCQSLMHPSS